jgi:hypothetical protein
MVVNLSLVVKYLVFKVTATRMPVGIWLRTEGARLSALRRRSKGHADTAQFVHTVRRPAESRRIGDGQARDQKPRTRLADPGTHHQVTKTPSRNDYGPVHLCALMVRFVVRSGPPNRPWPQPQPCTCFNLRLPLRLAPCPSCFRGEFPSAILHSGFWFLPSGLSESHLRVFVSWWYCPVSDSGPDSRQLTRSERQFAACSAAVREKA